jgi:endonuclease/exonuclease/phosphatase family metal-dependent hydrolase
MVAKKKAKKRKTGLITRIFLILNILVIFFLLLSYLSLYISPERNWALPFFGLLYPYILLINVFFVIYWSLRIRLYFILSLLAILAGWNIMWRTVQVEFSSDPMPTEHSFRIMSYNVRNMANNNLLIPDFRIRDAILDLLKANQPDLLCLQEFESVGNDPAAFIDSVSVQLGLPYYHFARYNEKNSRRIDAIITFSRFPVINAMSIKKDDLHNYCLVNDLVIGRDTVRLFNIHLESVRFRHEVYSFINDLDLKFEEDEDLKEGSRRIFSKLRRAYLVRATQVRNLKEYLESSPYPVIICGDFNDTPCSYTYQVLASGKRDAFIESGSGLGNTYAGTLPSLRIDYILFDPVFRSYGYTTSREKLSDHYPIAARVGYRD